MTLTGMTNNSFSAVKEPTCRFVLLGRTNIVNSTFQQHAGEKRPLDTDNLPTDNLSTELNSAKRNRLDVATAIVSSHPSPQVVGFPNIFISVTSTVTLLLFSILGFCVN